jgi:transposase
MPYAPYDYICPYKDSCPHLDLLSTTWALESYHRGEKDYEEHLRIVDNLHAIAEELRSKVKELEKENAELKAKLKLVHQRQFKPNKKKNEEQKEEKETPVREKKKRGAPVGHLGWGRSKPEHVDKTINVSAPSTCPHCSNDDLNPYAGLYEHMQEDIVI